MRSIFDSQSGRIELAIGADAGLRGTSVYACISNHVHGDEERKSCNHHESRKRAYTFRPGTPLGANVMHMRFREDHHRTPNGQGASDRAPDDTDSLRTVCYAGRCDSRSTNTERHSERQALHQLHKPLQRLIVSVGVSVLLSLYTLLISQLFLVIYAITAVGHSRSVEFGGAMVGQAAIANIGAGSTSSLPSKEVSIGSAT
ncbi:hypothetical protein VDS18_17625 [Xanthomonas campestris pv. campestris]|nr:hypothetical protein [Xanthomonas campestris pv. campestris]